LASEPWEVASFLGKFNDRFVIFIDWIGFADCLAHFYRGTLIFSNDAGQDFLRTGIGIKLPMTTVCFQRNGKRQILCANVGYNRTIGFANQTVHLLILLGKAPTFKGVLGVISRCTQLGCSENGPDRLIVLAADRVIKSLYP
jgi:hypothetical protein